MSLNEDILLKKCKVYDINDINDINDIIKELTIYNYQNIKNILYQDMKQLIYMKVIDCEKIRRIRNFSSLCKELNIDFSELLKKFVIDCDVIDSNIIKECTENEYRLEKSYRALIHIEHLILNLNLMINT